VSGEQKNSRPLWDESQKAHAVPPGFLQSRHSTRTCFRILFVCITGTIPSFLLPCAGFRSKLRKDFQPVPLLRLTPTPDSLSVAKGLLVSIIALVSFYYTHFSPGRQAVGLNIPAFFPQITQIAADCFICENLR